jgi:hypothetical protein
MCEFGEEEAVEGAAKLQDDINRIVEWCDIWLMKLNVAKCKVMHVGKKNPRAEYAMKDSVSGIWHKLAKTDVERDLGVTVASNLKSKEQVNQASNKADSVLGMLKRTFVCREIRIWKKLYTTYVRPHLEFAVAVWNPYQKGDIAQLESVQRRATKVAQGMNGKTYADRLILLDLTTLSARRIRGDLIQFFKIVHGIDHVNWQVEPRIGHPRGGEKGKYILENVKDCQMRKEFFTSRAAEAWNQLPDMVVEALTVNSFKARLDEHLRCCHG